MPRPLDRRALYAVVWDFPQTMIAIATGLSSSLTRLVTLMVR